MRTTLVILAAQAAILLLLGLSVLFLERRLDLLGGSIDTLATQLNDTERELNLRTAPLRVPELELEGDHLD